MDSYKTIEGISIEEITVERSRFIAATAHVESEEEALKFVASKKAEFHDARHNCWTYLLKDGQSRFSDDGEPHGTAGKPMADVLAGSGIVDACVVVTRYFGGVLLGTGGLVRAYSSAAKLSLEAAETVTMQRCCEYVIRCEYSDFDYMQKTVAKFGSIMSSDFDTAVSINAAIKKDLEAEFTETLQKLFMGRFELTKTGEKILPIKNFL